MHTILKFNRDIITKTSKHNLAEGLDLIKLIEVPLLCQNLNANIKRYLIYSTRALDLICQVRAFMSIDKI